MFIFLSTTAAAEATTQTLENLSHSSGIKLDLTITISVIIALCSIFSNMITVILNNRHLAKMKKIELEQQHFENTVLYKRNIFEKYLKATGKHLNDYHRDITNEYSEYYYLALMYVPADIAEEMKQINSNIENGNTSLASRTFESLAPKMRTILKNM